MTPTRTKPPFCETCGFEPRLCPTCGDFQCGCRFGWQGAVRQHYDKAGERYQLSPEMIAQQQRLLERDLARREGLSAYRGGLNLYRKEPVRT